MKKHIPKILAIVLLTAVAVLTVVAGSKSIGDKSANAVETQIGGTSNYVGAETVKTNGTDTTKPAPSTEELGSYFPIPPQSSDFYAYTQSLPIEGGVELNAVHTASDGVFIVITHSSRSGELKTRGRTVTVIRAETDGTLGGFMHLGTGGDYDYLTSGITSDGVTVAVKSGKITYVNTLSTGLTSRQVIELESSDSARIFTLNKGFLLFATGSGNAVYKIENNVVKATATLQYGEIKEVYDFGTYFSVFVNAINGYSVIKLDSALRDLGCVTVRERSAIAVQPVVREGKQKYIVAEATEGNVEIAEYFTDFSQSTSLRVGVGRAERAEVYMKSDRIFLLLHASTERLYLIGEELDYIASDSSVMRGVTEIADCCTYDGGFILLYRKSGSLVLLDLRDDGTEETRNFNFDVDCARLSGVKGEGLALVYAEGNALSVIGLD